MGLAWRAGDLLGYNSCKNFASKVWVNIVTTKASERHLPPGLKLERNQSVLTDRSTPISAVLLFALQRAKFDIADL
jgi:hypothetical protein